MKRSVVSRREILRGAGLAVLSISGSVLLTACGSTASTPPAAATSAPKPTAAAAAAAANSAPTAAAAAKPAGGAAPAATVELTYLNKSRGQLQALTQLGEQYQGKAGVKLTIDTPGPADYQKKLLAASQAGTMPDIYWAEAQDPNFMAPFYKAGWAVNLKSAMDQGWNKNFHPTMLSLMEFRDGNAQGVPPGIYHAPWEIDMLGNFYNTDHYQKANLDPKSPPTTIPAFLDALKAIKGAGIGAFVAANTYIAPMMQALASNYLSDAEIDATHAGKTPWASDAYRKALQVFVDLRDAGLIFNVSLTADSSAGEKSFYAVREVSTYYYSVQSIGVQRATAPDFTTYSQYPMPKAADAKLDPRPVGYAGKNGVVNAKGKSVDASLALVKWLTEKEQVQILMDQVPMLPANPDVLKSTTMGPQMATFAPLVPSIQLVTTPRLGPVNEAITAGVQSLLLKEKSIDQVLADADKAQQS
jgi:raffinose/stachyose/melibiose transport system substrate-binding protein